MNKIFAIAKREFLEKVRNRLFFVSLFLIPILMITFTTLPLSKKGTDSYHNSIVVALLDTSNTFYTSINSVLKPVDNSHSSIILITIKKNSQHETLKHANSLLKEGKIAAYILIKDSTRFLIQHNNELGSIETSLLISAVKNSVSQPKINPQINIISMEENSEKNEDYLASKFLSTFGIIILLSSLILFTGGTLVRSLLEEKASAIIEIFLSSCTALQILLGKILGFLYLGIIQIFIWTSLFIIFNKLNIFSNNLISHPILIMIYFFIGYIFYNILFISIGSIAKTEQDAQHINTYLSIVLMTPLILLMFITNNIESFFTTLLAYIPFSTPAAMILKLNFKVFSVEEIIISLIINFLTISIILYATSKVFVKNMTSNKQTPTS